jgi:hypothetical protein
LAGFSERDKVLVGRDPSGLRMHEIREIDLQMLTKLESLGWLSVSELRKLIEALEIVEVGDDRKHLSLAVNLNGRRMNQ